MFNPISSLPDDTLIDMTRLPTIVRNALNTAGLETVGDIRATSDGELRRMRRIGVGTLAFLSKALGSGPRDPSLNIRKRKLSGRQS
jgi:hypothetical protein